MGGSRKSVERRKPGSWQGGTLTSRPGGRGANRGDSSEQSERREIAGNGGQSGGHLGLLLSCLGTKAAGWRRVHVRARSQRLLSLPPSTALRRAPRRTRGHTQQWPKGTNRQLSAPPSDHPEPIEGRPTARTHCAEPECVSYRSTLPREAIHGRHISQPRGMEQVGGPG
jgi:hypothetical protein